MKTIAVIFGGRSAEHDVSIVTALSSVIKPLELTKKYRVEAVYIAKDGAWFWDDKLKDIKLFSSGDIEQFVSRAQPVSVQFDGHLTLSKASGLAGRRQYRAIDVVFPAMHGNHGEDGELMGVLQMANVPFVGCDMQASAIAMDKVLAKQVTEAAGIESTPWTWYYANQLPRERTEIFKRIEQLRYPLFVKPAHLGSSIGMSRVENKDHLGNALEVAGHYDNKVIVEQGVPNLIEVTLPIIGNQDMTPAYLEQPLVSAEDFFDFDTKYMSGGKKMGGKRGAQGYSKIPADLPKNLYEAAEAVGLGSYRAIGCSGIARIDMLIDNKAQKVFFNEVNPLPGSLYAHNWREKGISNVDLVARLVDLAEARYRDQQTLSTIFTTNFLKQF